MGYIWKKKGCIDIEGEEITPVVGQDVTELLELVPAKVIECLLNDRRIEDDSERKKKNAELMAEQQKKIDAIKVKSAAKKAKAAKKGK